MSNSNLQLDVNRPVVRHKLPTLPLFKRPEANGASDVILVSAVLTLHAVLLGDY